MVDPSTSPSLLAITLGLPGSRIPPFCVFIFCLPLHSLFSSCPFTASFLPAPSQPPFFHPPAPRLSWPFHQGASLLSSDPYHNSEGLGVVFWG